MEPEYEFGKEARWKHSKRGLDMSSSKESGERIVDGSTEMVSDGIVDESLYWTTGVVSDAIIMEA